jgi:hypothetical protein
MKEAEMMHLLAGIKDHGWMSAQMVPNITCNTSLKVVLSMAIRVSCRSRKNAR